MTFIPSGQWARYKRIINKFHEDANKDELIWLPELDFIPLHGEDQGQFGDPVNLDCLFLYNYFRTWPIIGYTINGEVDKQSCVALINVDYLKRIHPERIDSHNRLIYKPDKDLFIHRGDKYMATGDSFVSQAHDEPLLFMLILKRFLNQPQTYNG